MRKLILVFFAIAVAAPVLGQQPAEILWARGGPDEGDWLWSTFHYSPFTRTLIATTSDGEWLSWPLGSVNLPLRNRPSFLGGTPVTSALADGGTELITGLSNGGIYAWDLIDDSLIFVTSSSSSVDWLDATSNGNLIAFCSGIDKVLHVYDRSAGKEIITWPNSRGDVSFSPDGKLLLAGAPPHVKNAQGTMALIDVTQRKVIRTFDNAVVNFPGPVQFSPTKPGVFVVQDNDFLEMDTSGRVLQTLNAGTTQYKNSIAYSPSGNLLSVEVGGGLDVINLNSGLATSEPGHTTPCFISEDSIATTATNLKLISVSEARILSTLSASPSYWLRFPDQNDLYRYGTRVDPVTGQDDPQSRRIFPTDWLDPITLRYPIDPSTISADGSTAIIRTLSGAYLWPNRFGRAIAIPDTITDSMCDVIGAISPSSSIFAFALELGCSNTSNGHAVLEIWSTNERKKLFNINVTSDIGDPQALVFSDDGKLIAISDEYTCEIFNALTGAFVSQFLESKVLAFLPGDTSLLFEGYDICSLDGTILGSMPSSGNPEILRLPDGKYIIGFGPQYGYGNPDSIVAFFDLKKGKVTNSVAALEGWNYLNPQALVVNPATGDFAMGGRDLIYYKSIDPESSGVKQSTSSDLAPIQAFSSNNRVTVNMPGGADRGKLFVYRSDGRCYFTAEVAAGERSVTTLALPRGDYFIVFLGGPAGSPATTRFTKVSLFQ